MSRHRGSEPTSSVAGGALREARSPAGTFRGVVRVAWCVGLAWTLAAPGLVLAQDVSGREAAPKQEPPAGGEPKDFKLPELEILELANGLRATLVPFGHVPKMQVRAVVRTGHIDEGAEEVWLTDLVARALEEGAGELDSAGLAVAFAAVGGELRVGSGFDATQLSSGALSEHGPELIRLLAQVITAPTFPASELERLKNDLARRAAVSRTQPGPQANERFLAAVYGDHPYGRSFPAEEAVDGYTIEQVRAFHAESYGARRTHLYVVGVFDRDAVAAAIHEAFGAWHAGPEPTLDPPESRAGRRVLLVDRPGAAQSTVRFGLPVIDPSHEDYLRLLVTNTLLGGSFASRIIANLREDKGYTYSPFSFLVTRHRAAHWVQQADVTTEHTGAALEEVVKEIERLRREPPPEEELEGIKNYMAGAFVRRNSDLAGIAFQLDYIDQHGLGKDHMMRYVQRIRAVTPEDVQRMARTYLDPQQMVLVVAGDRSQIAEQLRAFGELE